MSHSFARRSAPLNAIQTRLSSSGVPSSVPKTQSEISVHPRFIFSTIRFDLEASERADELLAHVHPPRSPRLGRSIRRRLQDRFHAQLACPEVRPPADLRGEVKVDLGVRGQLAPIRK